MVTSKFNPDLDIPDLSGKVIFITGGTAGLGRESALALAKHNPAAIYISGRDSTRGATVVQEIETSNSSVKATFVPCDLASLASVKQGAAQFLSTSTRLDILMCNAGIMALPPGLTTDGYEIQFGTNHLGHALLIKLLLPILLLTASSAPPSSVRIVLNTSLGFRGTLGAGILFSSLNTPQANIFPVAGNWLRYAQSKLANILYAAELARRYPSITSVSVHPGVINTGLVSDLGLLNRAFVHVTNIGNFVSLEEGARNQLWAATATAKSVDGQGEVENGAFYEKAGQLGAHTKQSKDGELAGKLWEWTEKELAGHQA